MRNYRTFKDINITDFDFRFTGHGHYKVTYRSPVTGKEWTRTTTNMGLIDETNGSDSPKRVDLIRLKAFCKNQ